MALTKLKEILASFLLLLTLTLMFFATKEFLNKAYDDVDSPEAKQAIKNTIEAVEITEDGVELVKDVEGLTKKYPKKNTN